MKQIPPLRENVPAGFSVFKAKENPETFLYLEKGELAALVVANGKESELFKVHPGEVVGVQTLLEKQPLPYTLKATEDSSFLKIDEECLASALKNIPVWLLASIRNISQQIKLLLKSDHSISPNGTAKALAAFLLQKTEILLAENRSALFNDYHLLLKECSWITRIPLKILKEELISFERRRLVLIHDKELGIQNPKLLLILIEYLSSLESGKAYPPFHFNLVEKRAVHCLSRVPEGTSLTAPEWLTYLQNNDKFATVAEVILLEKLGLLIKNDLGLLSISEDNIHKFLLCFEFETEIKGALL